MRDGLSFTDWSRSTRTSEVNWKGIRDLPFLTRRIGVDTAGSTVTVNPPARSPTSWRQTRGGAVAFEQGGLRTFADGKASSQERSPSTPFLDNEPKNFGSIP
jgi:hypothetical protein